MGLFLKMTIFLLGMAWGSFLNCVILRLKKGQSFFGGRSRCPHCLHNLSWKDLIPVVSFLWLRGRCRYCGKKISWQYPLVELATGFLSVLVLDYLLSVLGFELFSFGFLLSFLLLVSICCFFLIIFVYDLKYYIIPNRIIYPAIVLGFFYLLVINWLYGSFLLALYSLIAALGAGGLFFLMFQISQGKAMGFGDVKLVVFLGLVLGFPKILLALFLAFLWGAFWGVILVALKRKTLKSRVPFGPFLIAAALVSLFWGNQIIDLYLSLLF